MSNSTTPSNKPHWFARQHENFLGRLDKRLRSQQEFQNLLARGREARAAREAARA